jgi:hypothetical protein
MRKLLIILSIIFVELSGPAFGQFALDLSANTIPKDFKGDNIVEVVANLNEVTYVNNKKVILIDKKYIEKVYAFKLSDDKVLSSSAGVWIEQSKEGIAPRYRGPEEVYYLVKDVGAKKKKWTGQNVFGAKVGVETTTEIRYFVTPINHNNISKLSVKPESGKIGVLFIGKPAEYNKGDGYISYCGQSYAATFDMPYQTSRKFYSVRLKLQEIWAYDQDSGKVLLKKKIAK